LSLPLLERARLLGGNWKIRLAAGLYFKRGWCTTAEQAPADLHVVRYWDLAATEKTELNDPDWTVGIKLGRDKNGGYGLLDLVRVRANPGDVESLLLYTASQGGKKVEIGFGQDPGQAGKSQAQHLVRAQQLHRQAGNRERRQAHAVQTVQLTVPGLQCEDAARFLERGFVPRPRRLP
jgi:phage terminase large subunit-like protein